MKHIITITTLLLAFGTTNAFWNDNQASGSNADNGIFSYNEYDLWDVRWYSKEFINMVDELEYEFDNKNNDSEYKGYSFPAQDV